MHDTANARMVQEYEQGENGQERQHRGFLIALAAVTLLAAILRLWAIDFGLPLITHPDEPLIYWPAERMVSERTLNPYWFRYPAFVIDVQAGAIATVRAIDRVVGLSDESSVTLAYTIGRFTMASLGIGTIWLTGIISRYITRKLIPTGSSTRELFASISGVLAALLLAVSYIHVKDSHFLKPDVPTAFFTTLTLWLTLRAIDPGSVTRRYWLLAGAAVGLAASAKYTGAVAAIMPSAALLISALRIPDRATASRFFLRRACEMSVVAVIAFLIINPYIAITPGEFLSLDNGIRAEMQHYRTGHDGAEGNDTWRWYLIETWHRGFGPTLTPLVVIGAAVAMFSLVRSRQHVVQRINATLLVPLLAFIVVYYASIAPYPVRFDRQLIPILPCLAILAGFSVMPLAAGFHAVVRRGAGVRVVGGAAAAALVIAVAPPFAESLSWGTTAAKTDTRYAALDWLTVNVSPGTAIAREWHTPPVAQDGFSDIFVRKLDDNPLQWYRDRGVEYVVLSSYMYQRYFDAPDAYPDQVAFYQRLLRQPREGTFEGENGPVIVILQFELAATAFGQQP